MVQKWNIRVRGRRDKGDPEVEQEVRRDTGTRLYNVPHLFPAMDVVVELTGKLENALRSEKSKIFF